MKFHDYDPEEEDIKEALQAKYPDPEHIEKRLTQIHEVLRSHDSKVRETQLPAARQERSDYLAKFGDLDPWLFLEQMGFKTVQGAGGKQSIFKAGSTEINFSHGYHQDKSQLQLTISEGGEKKHHQIPFFKSIDEIYQVMDQHTLPINQKAPARASYERKYISQLKNKPKK